MIRRMTLEDCHLTQDTEKGKTEGRAGQRRAEQAILFLKILN